MYDNSISTLSERLNVVYNASVGAAVDPHLSPDANKVAFVINDDLYFIIYIFQSFIIYSN